MTQPGRIRSDPGPQLAKLDATAQDSKDIATQVAEFKASNSEQARRLSELEEALHRVEVDQTDKSEFQRSLLQLTLRRRCQYELVSKLETLQNQIVELEQGASESGHDVEAAKSKIYDLESSERELQPRFSALEAELEGLREGQETEVVRLKGVLESTIQGTHDVENAIQTLESRRREMRESVNKNYVPVCISDGSLKPRDLGINVAERTIERQRSRQRVYQLHAELKQSKLGIVTVRNRLQDANRRASLLNGRMRYTGLFGHLGEDSDLHNVHAEIQDLERSIEYLTRRMEEIRQELSTARVRKPTIEQDVLEEEEDECDFTVGELVDRIHKFREARNHWRQTTEDREAEHVRLLTRGEREGRILGKVKRLVNEAISQKLIRGDRPFPSF